MDSNDKEVKLSDLTVINETESQSNTELNQENSVTESKIMDDIVIHSTPVPSKVKRLNIERADYMKDLHCAVNVDEYFDDTTVGNKHLPCDVIDVVDDYDDETITYLVMTNNTKADLTKNTEVDGFYDRI